MACPENVQMMADMSQKLTFLEEYLRRPMYQDRVNAALRIVFASAQAVTLSGTNTLTTLTQKGGIDLATTELRWEMKNRFNLAVRGRIT